MFFGRVDPSFLTDNNYLWENPKFSLLNKERSPTKIMFTENELWFLIMMRLLIHFMKIFMLGLGINEYIKGSALYINFRPC